MKFFKIKKILIPIDFSKTSLKALDYAVKFSKATNAEIILLHVTAGLYQTYEPGYFNPLPAAPVLLKDYEKEVIEKSDKHMEAIAEKIKMEGVSQVSFFTMPGTITTEILSAAKKHHTSLIVMGTHGVSGFREFFIGSNTLRVIRDADCPVLSVQDKSEDPLFKNILMPFRDKPHSREKVNYAIDLSILFSSQLHVLGVDTEFTPEHKKKIELEGEQIKTIAESHGVACNTKIISSVYVGDVVLEHARAVNADLIISMADMDKMDISEYFTGPFAQQIVNHSPIPVLSIRPGYNPETIDQRFY
jgi:nucleotide-binding universal stress UspA family protein